MYTITDLQVLELQLSKLEEKANAKVNELEIKLLEREYHIRQEVCREFNEQLIEIEEKHRWVG